MPNYLQADQVITVCFRGPVVNPMYIVSFNPDTGLVNWWATNEVTDQSDSEYFDGFASPAFILLDDPGAGIFLDAKGCGVAVNPARTRLAVFYKEYLFYVYDETLTLLTTVNIAAFINTVDVSYFFTDAISALPNGNFLLLVVTFSTPLSQYFYHFLELTDAGLLVSLHETTTPTTWVPHIYNTSNMAVTTDGREAAYIEPAVQFGQLWDGAGSPTSPPALVENVIDNTIGPWGRVVRRFDLVNDVELASVTVDADNIKFGIGYTAAKQLITGAAGQALSCSPVAAHCALANTTFGPGFVTRENTNGTRRALYRADPDLIWFEEAGDWLDRNSSWLDLTLDWRVDLRVVFGAVGPGGDYQTAWFMGNPNYLDGWIWLGATGSTWEFNIGNDVTTTVAVGLGTVVPYQEYRFSARYSKAHHQIETWLDDVLINATAVDMVAIDVDSATEMLGSDSFVGSLPDLGVSRVKHFQNGNLVANTPLLDASATNDTRPTGHDWVRNGSLADDDVAIDRFGDERGSIGCDAAGLYFWHGRYVRQLSASRLMLVERNCATGLRRRFFLIPWQEWIGPSPSGPPFFHQAAWFPVIHSIVPLIAPTPITDDDIVGEEEFLAGGVSGPLCWIEMTVREGN